VRALCGDAALYFLLGLMWCCSMYCSSCSGTCATTRQKENTHEPLIATQRRGTASYLLEHLLRQHGELLVGQPDKQIRNSLALGGENHSMHGQLHLLHKLHDVALGLLAAGDQVALVVVKHLHACARETT
jgi:hypothetical protein